MNIFEKTHYSMYKIKILLIIFLCSITTYNAYAQIPRVDLETGYIVNNGYIIYPTPDSQYTNIIEVGPGKTYKEIHDIPYSSIVKNTLVKIYYRAKPYATKVFIDVIATENERIRFQGIPDEVGNLPTLTAKNAVNWGNTIPSDIADIGVFVIYGSYTKKPAWIDVVNLHLRDGGYSGLWAKGDHISVKGCILENNANGVFTQANNQELAEISTYILIEGCKFINNGLVNSSRYHNIYAQAKHVLIQFNTIKKVKEGSSGASLKDRSSFTVIRYNDIETSTRTIDLVEPEDTDQVLTLDPNWDDVYVYGNLMTNKSKGIGVNMIHYGYDNVPTFRREGTLYFANNTVVVNRTDDVWRISLFDVNSTKSVVKFSNNILSATGMNQFNIFRSNNTDNAGIIDFDPSWFSIIGTTDPPSWQLHDTAGSYSIVQNSDDNILLGEDPGFIDIENDHYELTDTSPCISAGKDIRSTINGSGLFVDFFVGYDAITSNEIRMRTDQEKPNLGCFTGVSERNSNTESISQNYPNPFSENTVIQYKLLKDTNCKIVIYDLNGRIVSVLLDEMQTAGEYSIPWDGTTSNNKKVAKGYYFYSFQTQNHKESGKIIRE